MDRLGRRVLVSASDLVNHAACEYLTGAALRAVKAREPRPEITSPDLLARITRGFEHEAAYLDQLEREGKSIYRIETDRTNNDGLLHNAMQTQLALQAGYDVVYQPTFLHWHNGIMWQGHGDFAVRNEQGVYEMYDTKLARKVKGGVLIQLGLYSEMLASMTGVTPEEFHVVLGDGKIEHFRTAEVLPFVREFRSKFEQDIRAGIFPTEPEPVDHCAICDWKDACEAHWEDIDHLSRLRGMRPDWRELLGAAGITTVAALAAESPDTPIKGINPYVFRELNTQAKLQVRGRTTGELIYDLRFPTAGRGFAAMPAPRPGDLFLDFEANSLERDPQFAYLFVVVEASDPTQPDVQTYWADTEAQEKKHLQTLARRVLEARAQDPDMHVYHWGSFDRALMRTLMDHHKIPLADQVLDAFVDMYALFREGGRLSDRSMSIKVARKLWSAEARASEGVDGASSIAMREDYLRAETPDIAAAKRAELEQYCQDDTVDLVTGRAYLLDQVRELEARRWLPIPETVVTEIPRVPVRIKPSLAPTGSVPDDGTTPDPHHDGGVSISDRLQDAAARLVATLPDDPARDNGRQRARRLLADTLDWHRREQKPEWREHFARLEMSPQELIEDERAMGGLKFLSEVSDPELLARFTSQGISFNPAKSVIEQYGYDEVQEHRIGERERALVPGSEEQVSVLNVDDVLGIVTVKRSLAKARDGEWRIPIAALVPMGPPPVKTLQRSLLRIAETFLEHDRLPTNSPYHAPERLLRASRPYLYNTTKGEPLVRPGEDQTDAVVRLVNNLNRSVLSVQGPPGSGKTYAAAEAILGFLRGHPDRDGQATRIGVMASSHKVVCTLLDQVAKQAREAGLDLGIVQLNGTLDRPSDPSVRVVGSYDAIKRSIERNSANVFGGTAWFFARDENVGVFDLLVVEEAGQISLADTLAAAPCARNVLLVGDPQQLVQPIRGEHPAWSKVSAIGHVIADNVTMPDDRGVFFEHTRRLGDNCDFISEQFYDGRLMRYPGNPPRRILGLDPMHGLAFVPVQHRGPLPNKASSGEEAQRVAELVADLTTFQYDDGQGTVRPLTESDILVVTPYNAQVATIRKLVSPEVRVYTVDKAQGMEAPVVIYSVATSAPKRSPRGSEFVMSRNRLNVALSRAEVLSIVVAEPRIFEPLVTNPDDIRRIGSHLRIIEMASGVDRASAYRNTLGRMDIGARVRFERKQRGMTQRSLAIAVGCAPATIGRLERGDANSRALPDVAAYFGWRPDAVEAVLTGGEDQRLDVENMAELVDAMREPAGR